MNRIVVQFLANGAYRVHSDHPVELYGVDERIPGDRVFRHDAETISLGTVDDVVGESKIGFTGDQTTADQIAQLLAAERAK